MAIKDLVEHFKIYDFKNIEILLTLIINECMKNIYIHY